MQLKVQRNEAGYRFISILSEKYNAKKTLIWINKEIPTENNLLIFPIKNAMLTKTKKGSLVIRSSKIHTLHCQEVKSLYRGNLLITHNQVFESELIEMLSQYHSPAGTLGQTKIIFASIVNTLIVYWKSMTARDYEEGEIELKVI